MQSGRFDVKKEEPRTDQKLDEANKEEAKDIQKPEISSIVDKLKSLQGLRMQLMLLKVELAKINDREGSTSEFLEALRFLFETELSKIKSGEVSGVELLKSMEYMLADDDLREALCAKKDKDILKTFVTTYGTAIKFVADAIINQNRQLFLNLTKDDMQHLTSNRNKQFADHKNLYDLNRYQDLLSYVVSLDILSCDSFLESLLAIERWVMVAKVCEQKNDFFSHLMIGDVFGTRPINRLLMVDTNVPYLTPNAPKYLSSFAQNSLTNVDKMEDAHFKLLRKAMKKLDEKQKPEAYIPHIGCVAKSIMYFMTENIEVEAIFPILQRLTAPLLSKSDNDRPWNNLDEYVLKLLEEITWLPHDEAQLRSLGEHNEENPATVGRTPIQIYTESVKKALAEKSMISDVVDVAHDILLARSFNVRPKVEGSGKRLLDTQEVALQQAYILIQNTANYLKSECASDLAKYREMTKKEREIAKKEMETAKKEIKEFKKKQKAELKKKQKAEAEQKVAEEETKETVVVVGEVNQKGFMSMFKQFRQRKVQGSGSDTYSTGSTANYSRNASEYQEEALSRLSWNVPMEPNVAEKPEEVKEPSKSNQYVPDTQGESTEETTQTSTRKMSK